MTEGKLFPTIRQCRLHLLLAAALLLGSTMVSRAQSTSRPPREQPVLPDPAVKATFPPAANAPQATNPANTVGVTNSMEVLNDSVRLKKGDRISLRIVEDRREPIGLVVTDSGEMEIPYMGRVVAENKTCKQLAYEIKPLLEKEYFFKATVILGVETIAGIAAARSLGKVYVTGQVRTQGAIEILPDEKLTVSKAVLRAGGLGDFANKKKVKLIRKIGGGQTETIVDLAEIFDKGRLQNDPPVEADDVIIVPERLINF